MRTRRSSKRQWAALAAACGAAVAAVGLTREVRAADRTWGGGGDNNNFSTNANWVGGVAPSPNDVLIFDGFARLAPINDFAGNAPFGITFAPTAGPFNLQGNQLTLTGSLVDNTPVLTQTISLPMALGGVPDINVVGTGSLFLGGVLSGGLGTAGFTKSGDGLLTLGAANTFTGPVNITGGVLSVASPANLGAAPASPTAGLLVINGGALRTTADVTLPANRGMALGPTSGAGGGTIDVTGGTTLSYGGVIANNGGGSGGLTKLKFGTLVLSGVNTYTGDTAVRNGTLTLDFANAAAASNIVSPSSRLVLGGATAGLGQNNNATLNVIGKASANISQSFAGTNVDIYGSVINVTKGAGGTATVNLGALTHTVGGTVVIPTGPAAAAGTVNTTTTVAGTRGILGGWAIAGTPDFQRGITLGTDWAAVDGSGKIVSYGAYVPVQGVNLADPATFIRNDPVIAANADKNLRYTGTSTATEMRVDAENAGTTTDINTLAFTTVGTTSNTLTIGTGNTLRLGVHGGIFKQNNGNAQVYIGGSGGVQGSTGAIGSSGIGNLTAGGPNPNTPGEIVITLNDNSNTNGGLNIESNIVDNGTGAVTLVKTGVMSVKIDGHNTHSGGTFINQGRFQLAGQEVGSPNPDGLGLGRVTVAPGAYLYLSGVNSGGNAPNVLYTGRGALPGALVNTAQNAPIHNDMTISGTGTNQEPIGAVRLGNRSIMLGEVTLGGDARIGGGNAAAYSAINPDGTLYVDPGNDFRGKITGPFSLDIGSAVSIATNFVISNTANDWTGNTNLIARTGTATASATRLRLGNNEVIPHGVGKGNLVFGNTGNTISPIILDMNGFDETINGLSSAPSENRAQNIIENDGFTATVVGEPGARSYNITARTSTLTVGGFDQSATFGGVIRDSDPATTNINLPNPNGTGTIPVASPWATGGAKVALTKIGSGVQTLTGTNTYTGDTNVNGGTLSVLSTIPNSTVKVNAGGMLSGTGDGSTSGVIGTVVLGPGSGPDLARIAPGATGATGTLGTLHVGNLTSNGGDLKVDLVGSNSDLINVTGTASFPAGTASTISPNAGAKAGRYTILTTGTLSIDPTATITVNNPSDPNARPATYALLTEPNALKLEVEGGAKDITWTGATNGNWDVNATANWRDDVNPALVEKFYNGDSVTFGPVAGTRNIVLNTQVLPGETTFDSSGGDYTLGGSGAITGGGKLVKQGTGTLTVLTNNTYGGATEILGGTLRVGDGGTSGSLGTGAITNNGTLLVHRSDDVTIAAPISGTGGVEKRGAGVLTLGTGNTHTGANLVSEGTLRAGGDGAVGSGTLRVMPGATLNVNGSNLQNNALSVGGAGVGGLGAVVNTGAAQPNALRDVTLTGDTVFGGAGRFDVSGFGARLNTGGQAYKLTKVGTGLLNLNAVDADAALGDVDVQAGTLGLEGTTDLGNPTGTLRLAGGTVLQLSSLTTSLNKVIVSEGATIRAAVDTNNAIAGPITLSATTAFDAPVDTALAVNGLISGAGGVTKTGGGTAGGTVNLRNPANTYAGPTLINAGRLGVAAVANGGLPSSLGQSSADPTNLVIGGAGATLDYIGTTPTTTDRRITLSGSAGFGASGSAGASVKFTNSAPLVLTGNGNMAVTLSGNNTDQNTLAAAIADRTGGVTSLVKEGLSLWVLEGNNTYTGPTTLIEGTLRVRGSIANSSAVVVPTGAVYEADSTQTVKNMSVDVQGSLTIRPGGFKTLKVENPNVNQFAFVDVHDNALALDYAEGGSPLQTVRAAILNAWNGGTWDGFTGITSTTAKTNPAAGVGFGEANEVYGAGGGTFGGVPVDDTTVLVRYTLKGDATLDGTVNFDDLAKLAQNYNNLDGQRMWNHGDFTYDGNVNFDDLAALAQNYNTSLPSAGQIAALGGGAALGEDLARAFAQVPEPGALAVVAVAGALMAGRRRRR